MKNLKNYWRCKMGLRSIKNMWFNIKKAKTSITDDELKLGEDTYL